MPQAHLVKLAAVRGLVQLPDGLQGLRVQLVIAGPAARSTEPVSNCGNEPPDVEIPCHLACVWRPATNTSTLACSTHRSKHTADPAHPATDATRPETRTQETSSVLTRIAAGADRGLCQRVAAGVRRGQLRPPRRERDLADLNCAQIRVLWRLLTTGTVRGRRSAFVAHWSKQAAVRRLNAPASTRSRRLNAPASTRSPLPLHVTSGTSTSHHSMYNRRRHTSQVAFAGAQGMPSCSWQPTASQLIIMASAVLARCPSAMGQETAYGGRGGSMSDCMRCGLLQERTQQGCEQMCGEKGGAARGPHQLGGEHEEHRQQQATRTPSCLSP